MNNIKNFCDSEKHETELKNYVVNELIKMKQKLDGISSSCFGLCDEIIVYVTQLEEKIELLEAKAGERIDPIPVPDIFRFALEKHG